METLNILSTGNNTILEISRNSSQCVTYMNNKKAYIAAALAAIMEITSLGCLQCNDFSTRNPVASEVRTDCISMTNLASATSEILKSAGGVVVVELVKASFSVVEKVRDIQIIELSEKVFECKIFVDMPRYNDELMDVLISKEIDSDSLADKLGCSLQYSYLPIQFV